MVYDTLNGDNKCLWNKNTATKLISNYFNKIYTDKKLNQASFIKYTPISNNGNDLPTPKYNSPAFTRPRNHTYNYNI